jgi:hypothetical protein
MEKADDGPHGGDEERHCIPAKYKIKKWQLNTDILFRTVHTAQPATAGAGFACPLPLKCPLPSHVLAAAAAQTHTPGHVFRHVRVVGVDQRLFEQSGVDEGGKPHDAWAGAVDDVGLERPA